MHKDLWVSGSFVGCDPRQSISPEILKFEIQSCRQIKGTVDANSINYCLVPIRN